MHWMLMPLRRYADFSGRSRRMEFWMWKLFLFLIGAAFWAVMIAAGGSAMIGGDPEALAAAGGGLIIVMALYGLLSLAFLVPDIAVTVRRLHDTDRTGWWILAPIVPYIIGMVAVTGAAASGSEGGLAAGGMLGLVAVLAALVLGLVLLVFMFLEGTRGPNRYGPDPKGEDAAAAFQ